MEASEFPDSHQFLCAHAYMQATNVDVYNGTIRDLVLGVLYGINTTVFAYVSGQRHGSIRYCYNEAPNPVQHTNDIHS